MARLIRTEKEVEGQYTEQWVVVDEDALDQWPAGELATVGRKVPRMECSNAWRNGWPWTTSLRFASITGGRAA